MVHTSGVLAVVSTGLMISWRAPEIFSFQTRIRNRAVWDTAIFLLNGFIFILIGLKIPFILSDLGEYDKSQLIAYGLIVSGVTILVRFLWVFSAAYSPLGRNSKPDEKDPYGDNWKNVMIVAWTGTRGVVSLATALALPLTLADGSSFPQRSLILFLSFVVIFMTLVVQGVSLPLLIRLLGVKPHVNKIDEERDLRLLIANNTLNFIDNDLSVPTTESFRSRMRKEQIEVIAAMAKEIRTNVEKPEVNYASSEALELAAQQEVISFQRQLLITFHKEGTFNQSTIRHLEQDLDHAELLLGKAVKK
jgi:CPA1 family monovalent cation:H+ antiporter